MATTKFEACRIVEEYEKGIRYNNRIDLYETVKRNENFFIGRQWEGVNAPDLEKPVNNILKRVVSYFISQIVSDDISVRLTGYSHLSETYPQEVLSYINSEIDRVIEHTGAKLIGRDSLRDSAVDGDSCLHVYWDADAETGQFALGEIRVELIDNTNVLFGNPQKGAVEKQPYILLPMRVDVKQAQKEAKEHGGEWDSIRADRDRTNQPNAAALPEDDLVTVIVRYWRNEQTGTIFACKCTADGYWIRKPRDTELKLYPIAYWTWERVKNSYHGQSPITQLIPNQIIINKLQAMTVKATQDMSFPKVLYDRTKIDKWTNRIGEAIGVFGDPNLAIARALPGAAASSDAQRLVEQVMTLTRDTMGASDAALGNVRPDNTSAIIAVQKASSAPLELQKMAFYQWIEDYVRIFVDMMRAYYGVRVLTGRDGDAVAVDFSGLNLSQLLLKVNVGASAYWSELTQVQTLDNLFRAQLLDPAIYVESIPDAYIPNKGEILKAMEERAQAAMPAAEPVPAAEPQIGG